MNFEKDVRCHLISVIGGIGWPAYLPDLILATLSFADTINQNTVIAFICILSTNTAIPDELTH